MKKNDDLALNLGLKLKERDWTLAISESCTGGFLQNRITDISGSSAYFLGGVVAYSNQSKVSLLGVRPDTLETQGAVSAETALAMARGVKAALASNVGIGITGVAGPGGGERLKPVGLVYVAVVTPEGEEVREFHLRGKRWEIKEGISEMALEMTLAALSVPPGKNLDG